MLCSFAGVDLAETGALNSSRGSSWSVWFRAATWLVTRGLRLPCATPCSAAVTTMPKSAATAAGGGGALCLQAQHDRRTRSVQTGYPAI